MNTSNPTLSEKAFSSVGVATGQPMTLQGTVNKTMLLLAFLCVPAVYTWRLAMNNPAGAMPWIILGAIGGLVLALITCFKKEWAPVTAPLYAVAEGLLLGAVSAMYETQFHGIVLQAVMLTIGTLLAMLGLYTTRIIQPTEKFMMGVAAATGGIMLVYLISFVLRLFGVQMGFLYGNGLFGIGFSVVVVVIAALNLILNFGVIEYGVVNRAPKYMEWYSGFGLLVTLVWLYLEILNLLSKLASRRD